MPCCNPTPPPRRSGGPKGPCPRRCWRKAGTETRTRNGPQYCARRSAGGRRCRGSRKPAGRAES
eukprot:10843894-Lingulodinium_polyedra.AAC.1